MAAIVVGAVGIFPILAERMDQAATRLSFQSRYEEALKEAEGASAFGFRQTRHELTLIDAYVNVGDYDGAKIVSQRVLTSTRYNGGLTPAIAQLLVGLGDPIAGLDSMERAVANDPKNPAIRQKLVDFYSKVFEFARGQGSEELGQIVLDRVRSLDPSLVVELPQP